MKINVKNYSSRMLVLSPHMDDAVLDCFDHIQEWKQQHEVQILTVFSAFPWEQNNLPDTAKNYMTLSNFDDAKLFSIQRHHEDDEAMRLVGTPYQRMELPDASFRDYPTYQSIFKNTIYPEDKKLLTKLVQFLENFLNVDRIIVPLGIGGHIDHVLTKKAAETIFSRTKIRYYRDYPYGIRKRRFKDLLLKPNEESRMPMSNNKLRAIQCYTSQVKHLFPTMVHYEEVIYF